MPHKISRCIRLQPPTSSTSNQPSHRHLLTLPHHSYHRTNKIINSTTTQTPSNDQKKNAEQTVLLSSSHAAIATTQTMGHKIVKNTPQIEEDFRSSSLHFCVQRLRSLSLSSAVLLKWWWQCGSRDGCFDSDNHVWHRGKHEKKKKKKTGRVSEKNE